MSLAACCRVEEETEEDLLISGRPLDRLHTPALLPLGICASQVVDLALLAGGLSGTLRRIGEPLFWSREFLLSRNLP
jgi:hypothetical protein